MTFPIQAWHYLVNAADRRPFAVSFDGISLRAWTATAALLALLLGAAAAPFPLWLVAAATPSVALGYIAGSRSIRAAAASKCRPAWTAGNGTALAAVAFCWVVLGTALGAALRPAIGVSGSLGLVSLADFAGIFAVGAAIAAEFWRR